MPLFLCPCPCPYPPGTLVVARDIAHAKLQVLGWQINVLCLMSLHALGLVMMTFMLCMAAVVLCSRQGRAGGWGWVLSLQDAAVGSWQLGQGWGWVPVPGAWGLSLQDAAVGSWQLALGAWGLSPA